MTIIWIRENSRGRDNYARRRMIIYTLNFVSLYASKLPVTHAFHILIVIHNLSGRRLNDNHLVGTIPRELVNVSTLKVL